MILSLLSALAVSVSACGSGGGDGRLGERVIPLGQPVPKGGGVYRIGKPYEIAGVWYYPREDPGYNRVGRASWYGQLFHGRRTANGEIYDMDRLSAAHPTLPLPVYARVTNLKNRRSIVVRINDRGPYANDRIIDLSRRSAEVLGFRKYGTAPVRVEYLGRAPINGDDSYERRYLASQGWMYVATGRKSRPSTQDPIAMASLPGGEALPPENPDNLAHAWKEAAPPDQAPAGETTAAGWQTTTLEPSAPQKAASHGAPLTTGSIARKTPGLLVQAGSFKSKENADRARSALGAIAPVDIAPIEVGGDTYFRVRVGPFPDENEAAAALSRVTQAGYQGAKIVNKN